MEKAFYSNTLKKSIRISTTTDNAWNMISKIGELQWLDGIKSSKYLSNKKRGVGAIRSISFLDGTVVKEIIVGWWPKKYFSYIAISGLPLRGYHATISIIQTKNNKIKVEWESFFSSESMKKNEFADFVKLLTNFYIESLNNLKHRLEK